MDKLIDAFLAHPIGGTVILMIAAALLCDVIGSIRGKE